MNKLINQLVEKGLKETSALHTTIERIKVYANCINTPESRKYGLPKGILSSRYAKNKKISLTFATVLF